MTELIPGKLYKLKITSFWYIGIPPETKVINVEKESVVMMISAQPCQYNTNLKLTTVKFLYKGLQLWANTESDQDLFERIL
jgi:hypothetical protein